MNKKHILWFAFFCLLFWTCTDLSPFGDSTHSMKDSDSTLMNLIKEKLQQSEQQLSLPYVNKQQNRHALTRGVSYSTVVSPQWEDAQTVWNDDEEILLVPLQNEEELRSRTHVDLCGEESFQFSKTFSRLVVRRKGESTIAHVLTYLPDAVYMEEHAAKLDTMGYYPGYSNYEGIVLVSSLNGNILHGLLYKHGRIIAKLYPGEGSSHTHDCSHEHGTECEHRRVSLKINLYSSFQVQTRGGYDDDGGESILCSTCRGNALNCDCFVIVGEIKYCEDCGAETFNCKCNEEDDQPDLTICSVCGDEPCSCHTCRDCENNPCTCGSGGNNNEDKENENDDGNKEEGEGDNENEEDDKIEKDTAKVRPCAIREQLTDSLLFQNLMSLVDKTGSNGQEDGWVRTANGTRHSPSGSTNSSISYNWDNIDKNVVEWFHNHPNAGLFPNYQDLITLCFRARKGYIVNYEDFKYGVVTISTMTVLTITDENKFNDFATSLGNEDAKNDFINGYRTFQEEMNIQRNTENRIAIYLNFLQRFNTGLDMTFSDFSSANGEWNSWETKRLENGNVSNVNCE